MKLQYILPTALASIMFSTSVIGSGAINVVLNDTPLVFTNPSPAIIDSRTMLPVRGLFDQMGYTIDWDANTKTATLTGEEIIIYATPGALTAKNRATMEDISISSDVSPQIVNGYFMLPLRVYQNSLHIH